MLYSGSHYIVRLTVTVLYINHQYYRILAANQVVIFPSSVSWHTYKIAAVTSSIYYLTVPSDCLFVFHNVTQNQTIAHS